MRWEDIEAQVEGEANVDQNPFAPQDSLNNVANGNNARNEAPDRNPSPIHNQNRQIPESNRNLTVNNNNQAQINVTNHQDNQDQFYEEIPQEIVTAGEDDKEIPAEFFNAPDIDFDDEVDLDYYDLERERKKVKTDENPC